MKIAIAQLNPTIGDIFGNAERILKAVQQTEKEEIDLFLTPELSVCGYPPKDLLLNPSFVGSLTETIQSLAQSLPPGLKLLVGTVTPNPDADQEGQKPLYNSMVLLADGKVEQVFHKRLLPTYDVFDESRYFKAGSQSQAFSLQTREGKTITLGVTICEDLWNEADFWGKNHYQVNPIADLAALGVDIVINLSASPFCVGKQRLRESMLSYSAKKYKVPIIYVNQVGGNDDLIFDGNSVVFNQNSELVFRAKGFTSEVRILEFNSETKEIIPGSDRFSQGNKEADDETAEIWSALVLGVQDYARKCGFSQVILGLSGGIDSALVAAIAAEAMGVENVLGILMPSPYSSEHSVTDALSLVKNLGIKHEVIPIEVAMNAFDQLLVDVFANTAFGVAEENLQSRIRGNILMAIANKFGHLLLSTGNKSEMAVGYCTLYGDMNGGLAVIADVPKTRVFDLCRWLNRDQEVIPANILSKPPSAELKPGQLDQDSLPAYEILDDILERIIEQHQSASQIIEAGHDPQIVRQVIKLVNRAEFKRKQAPPGLKITDRAFGTGWRMPIASPGLREI